MRSMPEVSVHVEGTPNPNAAKFVLDRPLLGEGSRSYFEPDAAAGDPLAERLFEIEGVRAVFMVDDFVTVTKREDVEWAAIVERVQETIRSAFVS